MIPSSQQNNWGGFFWDAKNCEIVNTSSVGWKANDVGRQVNLGDFFYNFLYDFRKFLLLAA